ncbi:Uncharacterised protein [Klebsiella pneumoniae]|nr:Uncharacterised protein [Klebsiella pneumoniae]SWY16825.1 Uncharacterised protein [Klebsiella pneumoniae]SXT04417.1 Uncharacterised protein [Klebsiella pneumoniae]
MANGFVPHRFANRIHPTQPCYRHQRGMRAVKNGNLARFIGPDILYDTNIQRAAIQPQHFRQPLRPLDYK